MTYSFLNVSCVIAGPGGVANCGAGGAAAEEGITITPVENKNAMEIGADGKGQHSLIASDAKTISVKLLKTSPQNAVLMAMYNFQSVSSALWGQNVITVIDSARNDYTVGQACAFQKAPEISYKKQAEFMEWTFDVISGNSLLGVG